MNQIEATTAILVALIQKADLGATMHEGKSDLVSRATVVGQAFEVIFLAMCKAPDKLHGDRS